MSANLELLNKVQTKLTRDLKKDIPIDFFGGVVVAVVHNRSKNLMTGLRFEDFPQIQISLTPTLSNKPYRLVSLEIDISVYGYHAFHITPIRITFGLSKGSQYDLAMDAARFDIPHDLFPRLQYICGTFVRDLFTEGQLEDMSLYIEMMALTLDVDKSEKSVSRKPYTPIKYPPHPYYNDDEDEPFIKPIDIYKKNPKRKKAIR